MTDVTERNREPVTPNDDQTPRTTPTPTPHSLDDQLPPSLFAPPGKGSPPSLFGPVAEKAPSPPDGGRPPRPGDGDPPPLFGPPGGRTAPPPVGELPPPPDRGLSPLPDRGLPPLPDGDKTPPRPPGTAAPEPPGVSPRPGAAPERRPDRPTGDRDADRPPPPPTTSPRTTTPDRRPGVSPRPGAAPERRADRPTGDRDADRQTPPPTPPPTPTPTTSPRTAAPDRPDAGLPPGRAPERPAPDGPAADRPAPARPVPLDGNLHLKPVRRLRTEPSAEWTPHPSYGAEPGAGKGPARKASAEREPQDTSARGSVDDPGPDTELDLVLDLAPGDRAASATFSVPVPAPVSAPVPASPATTTTVAAATSSYPARRHSVIANETTASIPVHLLFRDDQEPAEAAALPPAVACRLAEGDRPPATRRPPVPRSPQTRVQPSTRPAPVADPRLAERPGPALSGYAALLTGAAGIAGALAVLGWRGALPAAWQTAVGLTPRADLGVGVGAWALLALLATVVLLALGGLGRGRVGYAWVLTLFGDYRGSVRRTGLVWVSPLLLRRRVDVRLRHWRSEPLPAVDANGTALRVVVLVVWRIKDTVRAVLGIEDHEAYLSAQVEAAMARVLSQLPADAFHEDAPSLRDAEAVGDALTRMLKADCEPVGVEVYSAQPTGIEYAPEVAAAMQRRRIAAIDSKHRDSVLTSVVDAVDDTVNRLTTRGIVELDDYERKALVKDLTVAFYTGRSGGGDGA
ncbi:SPFH domain-containing protein [Streptomyces sp. NPDC048142]|uniref:SPFH domain-containing protein n=1 Tax=Streptomyces sp. NPDC048142 TaxID=3365501 RepID=UPI0037164E8A